MEKPDTSTWTEREIALYQQSEERLALLRLMISENGRLEELIKELEKNSREEL